MHSGLYSAYTLVTMSLQEWIMSIYSYHRAVGFILDSSCVASKPSSSFHYFPSGEWRIHQQFPSFTHLWISQHTTKNTTPLTNSQWSDPSGMHPKSSKLIDTFHPTIFGIMPAPTIPKYQISQKSVRLLSWATGRNCGQHQSKNQSGSKCVHQNERYFLPPREKRWIEKLTTKRQICLQCEARTKKQILEIVKCFVWLGE